MKTKYKIQEGNSNGAEIQSEPVSFLPLQPAIVLSFLPDVTKASLLETQRPLMRSDPAGFSLLVALLDGPC